jgi:hypothetical protein
MSEIIEKDLTIDDLGLQFLFDESREQAELISNEVWTITFGEATESHVGMQISGSIAEAGFSRKQLKLFVEYFEARKCKCEMIRLNDLLDINDKKLPGNERAYLLVIRGGLKSLIQYGDLCQELHNTKSVVNKKALMRGVVKNKNARWGYCVNDFSQEPDYESGKGRIISFADHPQLRRLRRKIRKFTGHKLLGEVNYYYNPDKCYIGWHGDRERRLVIGCRLGDDWNLRYRWYYKSKPIGKRLDVLLHGGDMYIMSEKAVGFDWLKRNSLTLRHAAGERGFKL